jgi:hypothetical protein
VEEMKNFDYSQNAYFNLLRLILEGRATYNIKLLHYAYDYLSDITKNEKMLIESITRYLVEVK